MSNFLSIATVTAALRRGLLANLQPDVPGAEVTTVRPDRPGTLGLPMVRGVNLYLYKISPSAALRNDDLPTRDAAGRVRQRPRVALDLEYLFSFYGSETTLEPQRLMGSTVRYLHSRPQLTRDLIEAAMTDAATAFLARANLADEEDPVRFTPVALSLEDMSRIWSVFFQIPYVLSTAYRASVVIIEPSYAPAPALPVRDYGLRVLPFVRAVIEQAVPEDSSAAGVPADGTLLIRGVGLSALPLFLLLDGRQLRIRDEDLTAWGIRVRLLRMPDSALRAGVKAVKAVREVEMGQPPVPHRALESNVAAFLLQPLAGTVRAEAGELRLQVSPPAGARQAVRLLLDAPNGSVSFALDPVSHGTEPVRVTGAAVAGDAAFTDLRLDAASSREVLLSDPRPAFAAPTRDPARVDMATEDGTVRTLEIPGRPATLNALATALEAAIRAAGNSPSVTNARVVRDGDQLMIVPGASTTALRFGRTGDDPAADEFGLRTAAAAGGLLSGDLSGFSGLSPGAGQMTLSMGDRTGVTVAVGASPTLSAAASALESAVQSASTDDRFREARVREFDNALLIVHGGNQVRFLTSTVPAGTYLVRVEVDGAASTLEVNAAGEYAGPLATVP